MKFIRWFITAIIIATILAVFIYCLVSFAGLEWLSQDIFNVIYRVSLFLVTPFVIIVLYLKNRFNVN